MLIIFEYNWLWINRLKKKTACNYLIKANCELIIMCVLRVLARERVDVFVLFVLIINWILIVPITISLVVHLHYLFNKLLSFYDCVIFYIFIHIYKLYLIIISNTFSIIHKNNTHLLKIFNTKITKKNIWK